MKPFACSQASWICRGVNRNLEANSSALSPASSLCSPRKAPNRIARSSSVAGGSFKSTVSRRSRALIGSRESRKTFSRLKPGLRIASSSFSGGGQPALAVRPVQMAAAQAGVRQPGRQAGLLDQMLRVLTVQIGKHAARLFAPSDAPPGTVFRCRIPVQAHRPGALPVKHPIQPPGEVLRNDQWALRLFLFPRRTGLAAAWGHRFRAQKAQHHLLQLQAARRQAFRVKQRGKTVLPGKAGRSPPPCPRGAGTTAPPARWWAVFG